MDLGRAYTPRLEKVDERTVLLDLSGLGRTFKDPRDLAGSLRDAARARGIDAQVALAFTREAALVLARALTGPTVVAAGAEAATLAPLPLSALGLAPERLELFQRWGLRCIGDLQRLPAQGLAERLGPEGPRLLCRARGEDQAPLVPAPPPESFHARLELDWAVEGLEPLAFLLARVLEPLGAALLARGRKAQALTLELTLASSKTTHRRTLRPAAPSGDMRTWRTLLLLDLEAHSPGDAVTALALTAEPVPAREVQFSLLDPAQPSPEKLSETMARLHAYTSEGRGGAAALLDTHRPGAFVMSTFAPGPFRPASEGPTRDGTGGPTKGGAGRPARDGAREANGRGGARPDARAALRAFRPPLPAEVSLRGGAPVFVSAPGVRGAVADLAGPWRVSGDWWDAGFAREEWDVLVSSRLLRLVRDRLREEWFIDGEID
jgi:protein ImuB